MRAPAGSGRRRPGSAPPRYPGVLATREYWLLVAGLDLGVAGRDDGVVDELHHGRGPRRPLIIGRDGLGPRNLVEVVDRADNLVRADIREEHRRLGRACGNG